MLKQKQQAGSSGCRGSKGKGQRAPALSLPEQADVIAPIVQYCHNLYMDGLLSDHDLVAAYILSFLAIRAPRRWISGPVLTPVTGVHRIVSESEFSSIKSCAIEDIPLLADHLHMPYVYSKVFSLPFSQNRKHLCSTASGTDHKAAHADISTTAAMTNADRKVTLCEVFNLCNFCGVKNKDYYVNKCLLEWALRRRPIVLLFHIPSPLKVLTMQAAGERVVTMFTTLKELSVPHTSLLAYMKGGINHKRDPLEFLLHDFQHMEHFVNQETHMEQVGFFRCMAALQDNNNDNNDNNNNNNNNNNDNNNNDNNNNNHKNCVAAFNCDHGGADALHTSKIVASGNTTVSGGGAGRKSKNKPKAFFLDELRYDIELWHELEYAISDMNCYSTHLLLYVFGKVYAATRRLVEREQRENAMAEDSVDCIEYIFADTSTEAPPPPPPPPQPSPTLTSISTAAAGAAAAAAGAATVAAAVPGTAIKARLSETTVECYRNLEQKVTEKMRLNWIRILEAFGMVLLRETSQKTVDEPAAPGAQHACDAAMALLDYQSLGNSENVNDNHNNNNNNNSCRWTEFQAESVRLFFQSVANFHCQHCWLRCLLLNKNEPQVLV